MSLHTISYAPPTHQDSHGDEPGHGREEGNLTREQEHARAEGGDSAPEHGAPHGGECVLRTAACRTCLRL